MRGKREELLAIDTYEEFDKSRAEFEDIEWDQEMLEHVSDLSPSVTSSDKNIGMLYDKQPFKARPLNTK